MVSITFQLHEDYVALITARLENRRRALHCPLTGLPNRAFFDEVLRTSVDVGDGERSQFALLCLDLDGFKAVNEDFGHPAGDELLQHVAERLRSAIRGADMVARLGGDEFAILLEMGQMTAATDLASRIVAALAEPFTLRTRHDVRIGVSIGIAFATASRLDRGLPTRLMEQADRALYDAKRAGRGTFLCYDERRGDVSSGGLANLVKPTNGAIALLRSRDQDRLSGAMA